MSTKEKIMEKIQHIENEAVLEGLLEMIDLELHIAEEVQLTEEQKAAIDQGLQDIEEGNSYSDEQARKIVDEWMKKR